MSGISLRDALDAIALVLLTMTTIIRMFGLSDRPWAKPLLALGNDVVGAQKAIQHNAIVKNAEEHMQTDPGAPLPMNERYQQFLDVATYVILGGAIAVGAFFALHCSADPAPLTAVAIRTTNAHCRQRALDVVQMASTCAQAQAGLTSLQRMEPACIATLQHFDDDMCARDGGSHGHD